RGFRHRGGGHRLSALQKCLDGGENGVDGPNGGRSWMVHGVVLHGRGHATQCMAILVPDAGFTVGIAHSATSESPRAATAAMWKPRSYPASALVDEAATLASTATPTAAPTSWAVVIMPAKRPAVSW